MENNQSSKLLSMTDARVLCYVLLHTNLFFSYALSSVRYSIFSGATLNLFNLRSENGTFNCKLLNFTVFHLLFFFFTKPFVQKCPVRSKKEREKERQSYETDYI